MSKRSRVREVVLQILYQEDLNPEADIGVSERFLRGRLKHTEDLVAFGRSLLVGVRLHRKAIDAKIEAFAENWSLARMAVTDRNVLRIGAFEILFSETPDRVAINEAVELSKRFGSKHSPQFVNGLLDRVLKSKQTAS
ncbi:transcription antitermination factor NusB [Blastopirellula marina]|uniref:Transcription antitermination protein NusB n=1 Tax=Blastopirellula marina DSM 3645 TaxID=314230 RepID=A3ZQQ5_9BACT|nr:transcription antitermination factor NusB [Blastopirellula marina]EAQ80993.1 probable N utilization substance protein B-like [Blastopirellula marina DSM 3645]